MTGHAEPTEDDEPMSETDLVMTVRFKPGTMTVETCLEVQKKATKLVNAIMNDVQPGSGEFYKPQRFEWIDDGKDELTIRFSLIAPSAGPAPTEERGR